MIAESNNLEKDVKKPTVIVEKQPEEEKKKV